MTRDAMSPIVGESQKVGQDFGNIVSGNTGAPAQAPNVPEAPAPAPEAPAAPAEPAAPADPVVAPWICQSCGKIGIRSRFCPNCGIPAPSQN